MRFSLHIHKLVGVGLLMACGLLVFLGLIPVWLGIIIPLSYVLFLLFVSTNVRLNYFVKSLNSKKGLTEKQVAISFDDGPVENTLQVLDLLDKYDAKAGFFCIGRNIERYPEIFREIIKRGHVVGNHTYSHTRKMGFLGSGSIIDDIRKCDKVAQEAASVKLKLFRPPFGIVNPKVGRALHETGHQSIGWSIRSFDALFSSKDLILKRIIRNITPGDVILLHDNKPHSLQILEQLLLFLKRNQYRVVRPDILFDIDAYS